MARSNKSTRNQGPKLRGANTGKTFGNPMKPALAANVKNAQGAGRGLQQGKGGAKYVTNAAQRGTRTGVAQSSSLGTKSGARVGNYSRDSQNKAPIAAQPRYPKGTKNTLVLQNKVSKGDVARLHPLRDVAKAMTGGGFKSFIGGK